MFIVKKTKGILNISTEEKDRRTFMFIKPYIFIMSQEKASQNRCNRRARSYTIYLVIYFTVEEKMSLSSSDCENISAVSFEKLRLSVSFSKLTSSNFSKADLTSHTHNILHILYEEQTMV